MNAFLYGVLFVGISGLLFQIYMFFDLNSALILLSKTLYGNLYIDDIYARVNYQSFGTVNRMYTFAGEPGFSANLFILALAFCSSIYISSFTQSGKKYFYQYRYLVFVFLFLSL